MKLKRQLTPLGIAIMWGGVCLSTALYWVLSSVVNGILNTMICMGVLALFLWMGGRLTKLV